MLSMFFEFVFWFLDRWWVWLLMVVIWAMFHLGTILGGG